MNRNLSERQCMERHYLPLEQHVQRSGGEKKRVEAQYTEGLRLHLGGNREPLEVSEQKRDVIKHMIKKISSWRMD